MAENVTSLRLLPAPDESLPGEKREERTDAAPRPDGTEPLWRSLVGERLRELRHERGETLGETARRAGVSPQYLSEMERGVKEPSSEMIAAVAGALDSSLLDLTLAVAETLRPAAPAPRRSVGLHATLALAA